VKLRASAEGSIAFQLEPSLPARLYRVEAAVLATEAAGSSWTLSAVGEKPVA